MVLYLSSTVSEVIVLDLCGSATSCSVATTRGALWLNGRCLAAALSMLLSISQSVMLQTETATE